MTTCFKIFAEIEYTDVDEFEVYKKLNEVLIENGFKFRRATITEKKTKLILTCMVTECKPK